MEEITQTFKVHTRYFKTESVEPGTDVESLRYLGRGERLYGVGRQLMNRGCDDALVAYTPEEGEKGILLITRMAKPAEGYLWPLGGFIDRGVLKIQDSNSDRLSSLATRVKDESGLDLDMKTLVALGDARLLWNTTPYKPLENVSQGVYDCIINQSFAETNLRDAFEALQTAGVDASDMTVQYFVDLVQERDLPQGIDDTTNLFYVEGSGRLELDFQHKDPLIVTPKMYTEEFREQLHSYVRLGMDRAMYLI